MHKYAEAVDEKAIMLGQCFKALKRGGLSNDQDEMVQVVTQSLKLGEAYWLALDIAAAIRGSSETLPLDFVVTPDVLPAQSGFVYLEFLPTDVVVPMQARAFAWTTLLLAAPGEETREGVAVNWWVRDGHRKRHIGWTAWAFGRTVSEGDQTTRQRYRQSLDGQTDVQESTFFELNRFSLAFWLWIQQTILISPAQPLERHVARRLRDVPMEKGLRVVTLRRAAQATEGDAPHDVEWSCQWIVRGHWRNQYHPKSETHRPHWILPHVKGPADKPLKMPAETLFKVTR